MVERQFVEEGGYSEQLAVARLAERERKKDPTNPSDQTDRADRIPDCPQCGKSMVLRTAKTGNNAGKQFWGCTGYPECRGVVNL